MSEPISRIPNGFRYHSESDPRVRRAVEETAMSVFDGWCYEEIITPTVDYYSLFESGMGSIEAHRAFKFTDADGRLLALRPDVTSGIARAVATLFAKRPRPLRLCYAASVFHQEGQSHAEWRRESTQLGCELVGRNTIAADMEVLAIAVEVLQRLGLNRKYVITLNDVEIFNGIAESLALDSDARDELRQLIDFRDVAELQRFLATYATADKCLAFTQIVGLSGKRETFDRARGVITNARSIAALDHLEALWQIVESLGVAENFEMDLGDLSRLDYYTGLTFKIYMEGVGSHVGSGGRYDNLTAKFGKSEPAVGFVLKLDALADLMSRDQESPDISNLERTVLTCADGDSMGAFREAMNRRSQGQRVMIEADEVSSCRN
jgi:ATP phosphoribosyltransferase regulatory subunit